MSELSRLNASQREKVTSFCSFTSASETRGVEFMKKFGWNLEVALDEYFTNPPPPEVPKVDENAILNLFRKYAGGTSKVMGNQAVANFFNDLGVQLDDVMTLVISWQLKAMEIGKFAQEEFVSGFKRLTCASLEDIKKKDHFSSQ